MSMTPERIEEVKNILEKMNPGSQLFPITVGDFLSLLAALEESQQQLTDHGPNGRNYTNEQYVALDAELRESQQALDKPRHQLLFTLHNERANHEATRRQRDIAQANYKTYYAESLAVADRLVEAQQTIARQREALEFMADDDNWSWWGEGEDETVTWVGGTDPQHAARTALGNKEGSDKA